MDVLVLKSLLPRPRNLSGPASRALLLALMLVSLVAGVAPSLRAQYAIECTEALGLGTASGQAGAYNFINTSGPDAPGPGWSLYFGGAFDVRVPGDPLAVHAEIASFNLLWSGGAFADLGGQATYRVTGPPKEKPYTVTVTLRFRYSTYAYAEIDPYGAGQASASSSTLAFGANGLATVNDAFDQAWAQNGYQLPYTVELDQSGTGELRIPFTNQTSAYASYRGYGPDEGYGFAYGYASAGYLFKPVRVEGPDGAVDLGWSWSP